MGIKLGAVYISVKNMRRSVDLYEKLLEKKVDVYDEQMSVFDIDDTSLLLFNPITSEEQVIYGNNVVPTFEVDDVEYVLRKAKDLNLNIVLSLRKVDDYHLFQVKDVDGNVIEFYQVL